MLNISELSNEDKITELLNDVERKYSTFSIGNTLFPKIRIPNNELVAFFESLIEQINERLLEIIEEFGDSKVKEAMKQIVES